MFTKDHICLDPTEAIYPPIYVPNRENNSLVIFIFT